MLTGPLYCVHAIPLGLFVWRQAYQAVPPSPELRHRSKPSNRRNFGVPVSKAECRRSVWQNWLRVVILKVQAENFRHPSGLDSVSNSIKSKIHDIVAVFLRHGADPTASICISRHCDGGACKLEPLESVLATVTLQDRLSQLQSSRIRYSTRFNQRVVRHDRMLRAMRSWTASRKTRSSSDKHLDWQESCEFLSGFIFNLGGFSCDCSVICKK